MRERSARLRANAQTTLAVLGGALALFGLLGAIVAPAVLRGGDGFVGGIAILYFGVHALGGFTVLALGLLVPQGPDHGFHFTRWERRFLLWGAIAPALSVVGFFVGLAILPPMTGGIHSIVLGAFVSLLASGPAAVLLAIGSKVRPRWRVMLRRTNRG